MKKELPTEVDYDENKGRPRLCSKIVDTIDKRACKKKAVEHVAWNQTGPDGQHRTSYVCIGHQKDLHENFKPLRIHALGPACGMPGSIFSIRKNKCIMPKDELFVQEPVRTVEPKAVPA